MEQTLEQTKTNSNFVLKVEGNDRGNFLPTVLPGYFMRFENVVYQFMDKICPSYSGARWEFFKLEGGGFYMAPDGSDDLEITMPFGNHFSDTLTPDAAGILATLLALNYIASKYESQQAGEQYFKLHDYVYQHSESSKLHRALD